MTHVFALIAEYIFLIFHALIAKKFLPSILVPVAGAVAAKDAADDVSKTPLLGHHAGEGLAQGDGGAGGGLELAPLVVVVPHGAAGAQAPVEHAAGRAAGGVHATALKKRKEVYFLLFLAHYFLCLILPLAFKITKIRTSTISVIKLKKGNCERKRDVKNCGKEIVLFFSNLNEERQTI